MKNYRFITILILLLSSITTVAQHNLVPNHSFEEANIEGTLPGCNQYYSLHGESGTKIGFDRFNNDLKDWKGAEASDWCRFIRAYPSADWEGDNCQVDLHPDEHGGSRYVVCYKINSDCKNESIRVGLKNSLKLNTTYTIRMKVGLWGTAPTATIQIHFTKFAENWYESPSTTSNEQLLNVAELGISQNEGYAGLLDINGIQNKAWKDVITQFTVTNPDHANVLGNMIIEPVVGNMAIDDVFLYEGSCESDYNIENIEYRSLSGTVSTDSYIRAGYDVGSQTSNGDVIVRSDGDVVYKAGIEVSLENGFGVESGGEFHAYIANCTSECTTPEAIIAEDFMVDCDVLCSSIGGGSVYGQSYYWFAEPASAITMLDNPYVANPRFCYNSTIAGDIKFRLIVANDCGQYASDEIIIKNPGIVDLSTGTLSGTPIGLGELDWNWTLIQNPNSSETLPICVGLPGWYQPVGANWISDRIENAGNPGAAQLISPGFYTYYREFNITNLSSMVNPRIDITEFAVDNSAEIYLNGVSVYNLTGNFGTNNAANNGPLSFNGPFVDGQNNITLQVYNYPSGEGEFTHSGVVLSGQFTFDCGLLERKSNSSAPPDLFQHQPPVTESSFKVHPNPVSDIIFIEMNTSFSLSDVVATVYNMDGQIVLNKRLDKHISPISLSNNSPGLYYLVVETEKSRETVKIMLNGRF